MGKAITAVTRYHEPGKREQLAGRIMRVAGHAADPATCFLPPDTAAAARALAAMGAGNLTKADASSPRRQ